MPSFGTIAVTPGSGLFLDSITLVIGGNTVYRETMVLADPNNANNLANITSAGALQVDGSGVTQPISGSISFTVPQHVIVDSGASGGGTQFADNAASGATPTGTLAMGWDSVNSKIRAVKVDASQNLNVNIAANSFGTLTVQGTVSVSNFANPLPVSQSGTWNVRAQDGSGTALTSTGSALDVNIKTPATLPVSIAAAIDVSDRAARLVGVIYGSQAQQLKQTATNFNLQVELATGGTLYDARSIRALTSADVVSAAQSGSWTVTANAGTNLNTSALQLDATGQASLVAGGGTTAPSKVQMIGGKTNDGTAQYDIMPLGAGGRTVIIEGFAGGTAVPISGTVSVTNFANPLPVSQSGTWTVRTQDGAGNALTTNSTTPTGKFALDFNIVSILGTAPTAAGFLDVKATQVTSPWVVNMSQWGGTTLGTPTNFGTAPGAVIAGSVNASLPGLQSAGNSTTATLGSNAVFTGTFEDVSNYAAVTITVFADQASAANGLQFQWSPDGSNADVSANSSMTASSGRGFSLSHRGRFFRIVYTNGAVAQGAFRIQTTYHLGGSGLITRPYSQSVTNDNYASLVYSGTAGLDGTNIVLVASKGASTPAATADEALVVALSPNSPLPAGSAVIGSLAANQTVKPTSDGATAAAAPTSASETGFVDGQGNLQAASPNNPLPVLNDPKMQQVVDLLQRILACLESTKALQGNAANVDVPNTADFMDQVN